MHIYDSGQIFDISFKFNILVDRSECKHLLTADFQHGKFALALSHNEVTLFTVEQTVTVDNQGRLFLGDCDTPM